MNQNMLSSQFNPEGILRAYGVLSALHVMQQHQPETGSRRVLINDVLDYVQGRSRPNTARVAAAIQSDLTLRRQYRQLLAVNRLEHMAKPRAAHSAGLFERRVGEQGMVLKLKQSKGNAQHYYLILEIPDSLRVDAARSLVLHANTESLSERVVFPPLHDGRAQVILHNTGLLFNLLKDADVEIDIQGA